MCQYSGIKSEATNEALVEGLGEALPEAEFDEKEWIDDPVETGACQVSSMEAPSLEKQWQCAPDIAGVTAVPMHHPDSLYLKYGSDLRNATLMSGRMFVMQVAHPQVGAGVGDMSNFRTDPWHRLREIAKSGESYLLKGKEAALEEGRRLRDLHRNIKGVDSIISMNKLYGNELSRKDQQILFLQWQEGGRIFGLRDKDMPRDIDDYYDYYNYMIDEVLEYNEVMDYMLSLDKAPPYKPNDKIPEFLWNAMWKRVGKSYRNIAMFTLPPAYRKKIAEHQPWSEADQKRMEKWARVVKYLYKVTPEKFHHDPKAYQIMTSKPEQVSAEAMLGPS